MPTIQLEPAPFDNPITEQDGAMTEPWINWFDLALSPRVTSSAPAIVSVTLPAPGNPPLAASIGTTALIALAAEGLYRVSVFCRVSQAASVSSSILVTISGTDDTVPYTQSTTAQTGNLTTSLSNGVFLVRADSNTPISYATTYASVGTAMNYVLEVIAEQLV